MYGRSMSALWACAFGLNLAELLSKPTILNAVVMTLSAVVAVIFVVED